MEKDKTGPGGGEGILALLPLPLGEGRGEGLPSPPAALRSRSERSFSRCAAAFQKRDLIHPRRKVAKACIFADSVVLSSAFLTSTISPVPITRSGVLR